MGKGTVLISGTRGPIDRPWTVGDDGLRNELLEH